MSNAPERMWVDPHTHLAYSDDHGDGHPLYVRADIAEARIRELEETLNLVRVERAMLYDAIYERHRVEDWCDPRKGITRLEAHLNALNREEDE